MGLLFLLAVLFALIRFVVRRRCKPALRQTQRIAGDEDISEWGISYGSEGGISYGKWYLILVVFLSCTTFPIWIVGAVVVPIAGLQILEPDLQSCMDPYSRGVVPATAQSAKTGYLAFWV